MTNEFAYPYARHVLTSAVPGLLTGLGLIVAIGAQNAFVLRQGITRHHVVLVVVICAFSDLALIMAGVFGFGTVVAAHPGALTVARVLGAAFLIGYGVLSLWRARKPANLDARAASKGAASSKAVVLTALAFTWLNPHVYLDTVIMLGSIAVTHGPVGKWWFGVGAGLASILWFSALGFGARYLEPLFAKPTAWRILDVIIGAVLIGLAVRLVLS